MPTLWAFESRRLESLYRQQEREECRRHDCSCGCLAFGLWCLALCRYGSYLPLSLQLCYLGAGIIALVPWLFSRLAGADAYNRQRLPIITEELMCLAAVRLGTALLPTLSDVVFSNRGPTSFPDWLLSLPMAVRVPKLMFTAMAFRLPFLWHCLVHSLQLAIFLRAVPALCSTTYFQHASSTVYFNQASHLLFAAGSVSSQHQHYTGVGLQGVATDEGTVNGGAVAEDRAAVAWQPQQEQEQQQLDAQCGCTTMLWGLMVVLGYVLPSFVVHLIERLARAAFMAGRLHERGWRRRDFEVHMLFDWIWPVTQFVCLLPLVSGIAWHLAAIAAAWRGDCRLPQSVERAV